MWKIFTILGALTLPKLMRGAEIVFLLILLCLLIGIVCLDLFAFHDELFAFQVTAIIMLFVLIFYLSLNLYHYWFPPTVAEISSSIYL